MEWPILLTTVAHVTGVSCVKDGKFVAKGIYMSVNHTLSLFYNFYKAPLVRQFGKLNCHGKQLLESSPSKLKIFKYYIGSDLNSLL